MVALTLDSQTEVCRAGSIAPDTLVEVVAFSDVIAVVQVTNVRRREGKSTLGGSLNTITGDIEFRRILRCNPHLQLKSDDVGQVTYKAEAIDPELTDQRYLLFLVSEDGNAYSVVGEPGRAIFAVQADDTVRGFDTWRHEGLSISDPMALDGVERVIREAVIPDKPCVLRVKSMQVSRVFDDTGKDGRVCRIRMTSRDAPGGPSSGRDMPWAYAIAGYCRESQLDPSVFKGLTAPVGTHFTVEGTWESGFLRVDGIVNPETGKQLIREEEHAPPGTKRAQ